MKFGSKTGINEFYYLTAEQAKARSIEPAYLFQLVKAADDPSHSILVSPAALPRSVFVCRKTKQELRKLGHTGALKYIEWGEKQKFTSGNLAGMPWPEGIEVKNRKPGWYALPKYRGYSARVFWQKAYHDTYLQRYSEVDLIPDQRLYFLDPKEGVDAELLSAVLNSFVVALSLECIAPVAAGEGVCEVRLEDARDSLLVPNLHKITKTDRSAILKAFQPLKKRSILRVPDEVKQKDRQAFDSVVLKAIGLEPKKYMNQIYDGLCELVRERIELGQMRGKARKTKSRGIKAEKKATEEVIDEVLPEGPKAVPR
jgi:type I restriction enzyme M protein